MSDFIDQLKSVSRTPEQIQEEKIQVQRRKEENDAQALEKCKNNFAREIARRIKSDAIEKANSGKYDCKRAYS